jgi:Na+/H+ antiporter NhaA
MGQEDLSYSRITHLPDRPIERIQQPLTAFMRIESASGVVLLICTAVALIAANSPYAEAYQRLWNRELRIAVGELELAYPLDYWINDALMGVLVIVIFYTASISATWLAGAVVGLVRVAALNRLRVRSVGISFIAALGLSGRLLVSAKIGIIVGPFASAVIGMSILSSRREG